MTSSEVKQYSYYVLNLNSLLQMMSIFVDTGFILIGDKKLKFRTFFLKYHRNYIIIFLNVKLAQSVIGAPKHYTKKISLTTCGNF